MNKYDYLQSNANHTLFLKCQIKKVMALIIYVIDMIIIRNDEMEISKLKDRLVVEFEMTNIGSLKYFWELKW